MSKVLSEYNFDKDQALSRTPKASQTHGKSEKLLYGPGSRESARHFPGSSGISVFEG